MRASSKTIAVSVQPAAVGSAMAIEVSKSMRFAATQATPFGNRTVNRLAEQPVLATILRRAAHAPGCG